VDKNLLIGAGIAVLLVGGLHEASEWALARGKEAEARRGRSTISWIVLSLVLTGVAGLVLALTTDTLNRQQTPTLPTTRYELDKRPDISP
jgi:hypothetical protein